MNIIRGRVFTFGNNIDTDQIYPGRYLELTEHDEIAAHVMEGADPSFASKMKRGTSSRRVPTSAAAPAGSMPLSP